MKKNLEGLVHVYAGTGKGKTTAAIGLGVRAALNSLDVIMIKFIKGNKSGEDIINKYIPNFEIYSYGTGKMIKGNLEEEDKRETRRALSHARKAVKEYDMVILDEVLYAIQLGLVTERQIVRFIKGKPKDVELVLTGGWGGVSKRIVDLADYVSVIRAEKHPYLRGARARKGIEY